MHDVELIVVIKTLIKINLIEKPTHIQNKWFNVIIYLDLNIKQSFVLKYCYQIFKCVELIQYKSLSKLIAVSFSSKHK